METEKRGYREAWIQQGVDTERRGYSKAWIQRGVDTARRGYREAWIQQGVDTAKREIEEELYRKLDEGCGKKLMYKLARESDGDSKDVKTESAIKDTNGKLITNKTYVSEKIISRNY